LDYAFGEKFTLRKTVQFLSRLGFSGVGGHVGVSKWAKRLVVEHTLWNTIDMVSRNSFLEGVGLRLLAAFLVTAMSAAVHAAA
jgi:hypothetical protein